MNQEQNNFNMQSSNETPNNQTLQNNQNISVNQSTFNPQPQPMNNMFESSNTNNQNFNSKPPKKNNLGLVIGIVVVVAIIGIGIVFASKLFSNNYKDNNSTIPGNTIQNNTNTDDKKENEVLTEEEKIEKLKKEYKTNSNVDISARLGQIKYGYQKLEIDIKNNSKKNIKRVDFYVVTYDLNKNQISKGYMASDTILEVGKIKNGEWNLVGENIHSFDLYVWGIQFDDGSIWGEESLNEDILIQCALKIV